MVPFDEPRVLWLKNWGHNSEDTCMAGSNSGSERGEVARRSTPTHRERLSRFADKRRRGQRGAVMVEAALVLPVMVLIVMGIIEFGFAFASSATTSGASRSGARLGAAAYATAAPTLPAQQIAVDKMAATVSADLIGLTSATPVGMTVYEVNPASTSGEPYGGFPGDNLAGGCTTSCFRYTWQNDTMTYVSGSWPDPDACGTELDSIGVFLQVDHEYISGVVGDQVYIDGHTVMRLEPLPSDQCAGE